MSDITVIIPVYNVEDYIVECLDSVIRQTYAPSEILIVNDGSTDDSRKICQYYADIYSNIRLLDQENQGVSSARNKGLDYARGDYVVFVDSDDFIADNMLSVLIQKMNDTDSDIVQCGLYYLYENNRIEKYIRIEENDVVLNGTKEFFHAMFERRLNSYVCASIYRKSLFDNLRFDEKKIMEDTFIKPHLFIRSKRITIVPECLYYYRQRAGSIMHDFNHRRFDIIESIKNLEQILIDIDLYNHFRDRLIIWNGYHLMILMKHMAKSNNYFSYIRYRAMLFQYLTKERITDMLQQWKRISSDYDSTREQAVETKKIYNVVALFLKKKNIFWLKVKYNTYRKKFKVK